MRKISLADDLKVRFPARSVEFDDGFEVGMIAALMSLKETEFRRTVGRTCVAQLGPLAEKLGYYVMETPCGDDVSDVTFRSRRAKPRLRIVHSAPMATSLAAPVAGLAKDA